MIDKTIHPWKYQAWSYARLVAGAGCLSIAIAGIIAVVNNPHRWEWWFFTANDLGLTMAAVLCLCIGTLGSVSRMALRWRIPASLAVLGLTVTAGTALVASCSRSGWVALLAAAALMAASCHNQPLRRSALMICMAVIMAIQLTPKAYARAETMITPFDDGSVQCRLEMWSGATAMIAEHPLTGCGVGRFGAENENWYLPHYRGIHLFHAFNDMIFIAAERGLLTAYLYIAILLSSLAALAVKSYRSADCLSAGLSGGLAAFVIGGAFTTLVIDGAAIWITGFALAAFAKIMIGSDRWRILSCGLIFGVSAAMMLAFTLEIIGLHNADVLPYRPAAGALLAAGPRHLKPNATVVVLRTKEDTDRIVSEYVLRPLASAGLQVIVPDLGMDEVSYTAKFKATGRTMDNLPVIILSLHGSFDQAQRWWNGFPDGPKPIGAILLDAPLTSEDDGISPPCPVLLCDGTQVAQQARIAVANMLVAHHPESKRVTLPPFALWPRYFSIVQPEVVAWISARVAKTTFHGLPAEAFVANHRARQGEPRLADDIAALIARP